MNSCVFILVFISLSLCLCVSYGNLWSILIFIFAVWHFVQFEFPKTDTNSVFLLFENLCAVFFSCLFLCRLVFISFLWNLIKISFDIALHCWIWLLNLWHWSLKLVFFHHFKFLNFPLILMRPKSVPKM